MFLNWMNWIELFRLTRYIRMYVFICGTNLLFNVYCQYFDIRKSTIYIINIKCVDIICINQSLKNSSKSLFVSVTIIFISTMSFLWCHWHSNKIEYTLSESHTRLANVTGDIQTYYLVGLQLQQNAISFHIITQV